MDSAHNKTPFDSRERPRVVLVPGMCGSRLRCDDLMTWPCTVDPLRSLDLMQWREESQTLQADAVIDRWGVGLFNFTTGYGHLRDVLTHRFGYRRGEDLFEFAYDWRQDCRRSAAQLGEQLTTWLAEQQQAQDEPVIVLAHSMGGLVARYWIEHLGGAALVSHLVLFGSPAYGAPLAFQWLAHGPAFIPLPALRQKLSDLVRSMPAMYQVLPQQPVAYTLYGRAIDIYKERGWLPEAYHQLLDDGRAFHEELRPQCTVPTLCVVGEGMLTPSRAWVDFGHPNQWETMHFLREASGDGMVPSASAQLEDIQTFKVFGGHEDILSHPKVWQWLTPQLFGFAARRVSPRPKLWLGHVA